AGQSYTVSVTYKNTGSATWTQAGGYYLGSQNAQDNTIWGINPSFYDRVAMPSGGVAPGASVTFSFTVKAPATAGTYNFQRRVLQSNVAWFGDVSANVAVSVTTGSSAPSSPTNLSASPVD